MAKARERRVALITDTLFPRSRHRLHPSTRLCLKTPLAAIGCGVRWLRSRARLVLSVSTDTPAANLTLRHCPRTPRSISLNRSFQAAPSLIFSIIGMLCMPACSAGGKRSIDFSNYDTPLYEQIKDRITERVATRFDGKPSEDDRYFIIPFAYEDKGNSPELSHSFMTVIRVYGDSQQPKANEGEGLEGYFVRSYEYEAFTISWLPADFVENPNLCVFKGIGAAIDPNRNDCPVPEGKNFDLPTTLQFAVQAKVAVCMWGPYEITKGAFDTAVGRLRLLDSGKIRYRADDRPYRKHRLAINCFHAMAGLDELYPDGGIFGTGFKIWGINGTKRVLKEYEARSDEETLLLEPVDEDNDRIGFVYAPTSSTSGVYNPFTNRAASAYRQ